MKTLYCRDAGFDCEGVIQAENEEQVLHQGAQHAKDVHNVSITPELSAGLRSLIKDDN